MNLAQMLSVLSALAAAVWSVWTWSEEQQKDRQIKRDQEAALYVNAFLFALEELQSRLYGILEEDELALYKQEYPEQYALASPAAIALLYHLSQYFGWAYRIYRYGPYTKDPRVMALIRELGNIWNSRGFAGDAFRFSMAERVALGEAVVRPVGEVTAVLPVFEAIPLYQFQEDIRDNKSPYAPLYQSQAIRCTLAAIDRAEKAEALEGYERLAVVQHLLVDLLAYLESREGLSVLIGEHRKARLRGAHSRVLPGPATMPSILHQSRGRIRLGVPRVKTDKAYAHHLQSLVESMEHVTSMRINAGAASVIICYSPAIPEAEFARTVVQTMAGHLETIPPTPAPS